MTFWLEHCRFFKILLSGLKEVFIFSLKLPKPHNILVDYTFVNRNKTFAFLVLDPPKIQVIKFLFMSI